jgi:23S rRNA pseudouridine1911/1915/1917 synthase
VDAVIAAAEPDLTRARVQRLIARDLVTVNGEPVRKSATVDPGDRIAFELPANQHEAPVTGLNLPVLYEDSVLLVIDKPAGLAVHGAPGDESPTVAAWFLERYPDLASAFEAERPGIVHRLDKDTSGVLLLAKIPAAQSRLSAAFAGRTVEKTYLAICDGVPGRPHAIVEAPIARHPGDRTRMAVMPGGRAARTEYELLGDDGERSLLLVHPETGRTHQIRVHLSAIGFPVAQDSVYGKRRTGRQLLHAWRLQVPHPDGGTLTATAPLPPDMAAVVRSMGLEPIASPYLVPVAPERTEDHS